MNTVPINSITLADGIKYPAPVTKAYAEQQKAEAEYTAAIVALTTAEAELLTAQARDHQALIDAASAGTGHPGNEKVPKAQRAADYAEEVAIQAQARYIDAASVLRRVLKENAEAVLPLAIALAREAQEQYDEKAAAIHRMITEANTTMQNAAYSLNMLRPHIDFLHYNVNWLPVTATVPGSNQLGNMGQVANQLERILAERANPAPTPDRWPVAISE